MESFVVIYDMKGKTMVNCIKQSQSRISRVYFFDVDDPSNLVPDRKPSELMFKNHSPYAMFNLQLRDTAQYDQDITLGYSFLDATGNSYFSGTMPVHLVQGSNMISAAFDTSNDAPGFYRVKFFIAGTDDPGMVFAYGLVDEDGSFDNIPTEPEDYPLPVNTPCKDIKRVELRGANDQNNFWNADLLDNNVIFNDTYTYAMFNIYLSDAFQEDKTITLRTVIRGTWGNTYLDESDVFDVHPGYDRLAKSLLLIESGHRKFWEGLLYTEFSIDGGDPYVLEFQNTIDLDKEVERQMKLQSLRKSNED